jgi:hypothetical protein
VNTSLYNGNDLRNLSGNIPWLLVKNQNRHGHVWMLELNTWVLLQRSLVDGWAGRRRWTPRPWVNESGRTWKLASSWVPAGRRKKNRARRSWRRRRQDRWIRWGCWHLTVDTWRATCCALVRAKLRTQQVAKLRGARVGIAFSLSHDRHRSRWPVSELAQRRAWALFFLGERRNFILLTKSGGSRSHTHTAIEKVWNRISS